MATKFRYDVFLISAIEDIEIAQIVARRLRALKMKVWFDKDRTDKTFDAEDAANAEKSRNMLVLWSHTSDKSDWVHAAARTGRSRDILIQTAIDDVVPRDPFHLDDRIDIAGLTGRKLVPGFAVLAGQLGDAQGRKGLDEYVGLSKDEQAAWQKKHSTDPLAKKPAPKAAKAKAPAGPYISEMRAREEEWAAWTVEGASGLPYGVPSDLSLIGGIADHVKVEMRKRGVGTLALLAMLPDDRLEELEQKLNLRKDQIRKQEWVEQAREILDGKPPRAKTDLADWNRFIKDAEPAPARAMTAAALPAAEPEERIVYVDREVYVDAPPAAAATSADHIKIGILTAILAAIAFMFFLGWLFGKEERAALTEASTKSCPAGQYPMKRPEF